LKKLTLLIITLLILTHISFGQNRKVQFISYNILFGGLTGGLGSIINKQKNQPWHRALKRGFIAGGLGGVFTYSGKLLSYQITKKNKLAFSWPSKLLHSVGNSMVVNAASGKDFGTLWRFNLSFIHFNYNRFSETQFHIQFSPFHLVEFIWSLSKFKFASKETLLTGIPIFYTKKTEIF